MKERFSLCLWPLAAIIWFAMPSVVYTQSEKDPCYFFPDGTKLRDPDDCGQEIICKNFNSVSGVKCTDSAPFYNKDTYKCQTHLTDNSTCAINCTEMVGKFVKDPKSCYGYYYCKSKERPQYGRCPQSLHFNETRQSCGYSSESECRVKKLNFCAIVASGVKFKDESNCGRYMTCALNTKTKEVEIKTEYCGANAMYYHPSKGICVAEPIKNCRPVPKDVCIVNKKIKKNYFVNDGATCRGSFYCANVGNFSDPNPTFNQCPGNQFFSQENQKCLSPHQVVCVKDRCEGSGKRFVVSSQKACRNYLICEDDVKVAEGSCGNNFFDEERGECTLKIMTYPACYYK